MPANLENSAVIKELEKVSFHYNPKERQCQKCSYYHTVPLISHASKVMLKILQARLQEYVNLQMLKLDLEKAEAPEIKFPTSEVINISPGNLNSSLGFILYFAYKLNKQGNNIQP